MICIMKSIFGACLLHYVFIFDFSQSRKDASRYVRNAEIVCNLRTIPENSLVDEKRWFSFDWDFPPDLWLMIVKMMLFALSPALKNVLYKNPIKTAQIARLTCNYGNIFPPEENQLSSRLIIHTHRQRNSLFNKRRIIFDN